MSLYDFVGAAFSGAWSKKEFNDRVRSDIEQGFDIGWQNLGRAHEEPVGNHFKEKTIYHRNGSETSNDMETIERNVWLREDLTEILANVRSK